jgi:predicted 3-demethylubiquinone-9 3-methyltransferase (glyoxalase superfamily)
MVKVRTCLWSERDAEQAVRRYVELIPASHIEHVQQQVKMSRR